LAIGLEAVWLAIALCAQLLKHSVLHPLKVRGDAQAGNGKTLAPTCELLRRDVRQTKAVVFDFTESRGGLTCNRPPPAAKRGRLAR
jgi:hypothetical protein